MADTKLQSFNVFLTQRLTAAAVEIFGFVEKTIIDYNEEVYRGKQENQRLQRLLDLVYKPEIRLQRAETNQLKPPVSTKEASLQEQNCELELIPSVVPEQPGLLLHIKREQEEFWTSSEEQPHTLIGYNGQNLHYSGPVEHSNEGNNSNKLYERGQHADIPPLELDDGAEPSSAAEANCSEAKKKYSKPPTFPASTEEISPKQQPIEQEWNPGLEEPGPSQIKVEDKLELWTGQNEEPPSAEDSDDGDALTRELIKTVQELENHTTTENSTLTDNSEPQPSSAEDPNGIEATKSNDTFYRCHICNFIFTKEVVLTWHLKTHTDKGTFDCQICGKHIPCQSTLQTHMRVHTGERPYSCHFCGKSFKLKGHMKEHIRTHTGEKPFICHICGKSFNRGSTMRKHVFVKHNEERPYKCTDCDELFTERLLMKRHMRKVHGVKLST